MHTQIIDKSWLDSLSKLPHHPLGELPALQRLSQSPEHPHVVPLIEAMMDEHHQYIVTPYVDGGDLFEMVQQHPKGLPEREACRLFLHIVSGLRHLKKHGLSHG